MAAAPNSKHTNFFPCLPFQDILKTPTQGLMLSHSVHCEWASLWTSGSKQQQQSEKTLQRTPSRLCSKPISFRTAKAQPRSSEFVCMFVCVRLSPPLWPTFFPRWFFSTHTPVGHSPTHTHTQLHLCVCVRLTQFLHLFALLDRLLPGHERIIRWASCVCCSVRVSMLCLSSSWMHTWQWKGWPQQSSTSLVVGPLPSSHIQKSDKSKSYSLIAQNIQNAVYFSLRVWDDGSHANVIQ